MDYDCIFCFLVAARFSSKRFKEEFQSFCRKILNKYVELCSGERVFYFTILTKTRSIFIFTSDSDIALRQTKPTLSWETAVVRATSDLQSLAPDSDVVALIHASREPELVERRVSWLCDWPGGRHARGGCGRLYHCGGQGFSMRLVSDRVKRKPIRSEFEPNYVRIHRNVGNLKNSKKTIWRN